MNGEKNNIIGTAEYHTNFWNAMRGNHYDFSWIRGGSVADTGGYILPSASGDKFKKATRRESLFRDLATVVMAYGSTSRIFARDCADLAAWVPESGSIPIHNGGDDFICYPVEAHKLAICVRLGNNFVHDAAFGLEDYLTSRLAKNFAKAEDLAFISGTGAHMPTGILDSASGAEIGVTADALSFDAVISLYHSLDTEYRGNAVWLMNDETALSLRRMKDNAGDYLWNHANDTILGKPVRISKDMPSVITGKASVLFGDLSYYWIIDRSPINVRVLEEAFAMHGQIGYLATESLDGRLIRRDAVKSLLIAG